MKKIVLLFSVAVGLSANNLLSQGKYVSLGGGYSFANSSGNIEGFTNEVFTSNSFSEEPINISYGKGINFGLSFGYMFNKNFGLELGFLYLKSSKIEATKVNYMTNETDDYTTYSTSIQIIPSIVVSGGSGKIIPYAKFGLIISTGNIHLDSESFDGTDIMIVNFELTGGVGFGVKSSIGMNVKLNKLFSIYTELNNVSLSYAPLKGKIYEASINGVDYLDQLSPYEKDIDFVDKYVNDSNNPQQTSIPSKVIKGKYQFSSFGINLGIRLNF